MNTALTYGRILSEDELYAAVLSEQKDEQIPVDGLASATQGVLFDEGRNMSSRV